MNSTYAEKLADEGYFISTDLQLIDFDEVYAFLENESYWAKGVTKERLRKAISNSFCFGIYKNNKQAGFARVVTDKATFAYICDVFVLQQHRGKRQATSRLRNQKMVACHSRCTRFIRAIWFCAINPNRQVDGDFYALQGTIIF